MSTIRDPATITKVGRQMMTAGGDITYTKATLYGQDISHLTKDQLESLTSIGNPLVTVPLGISDKNDNGNGTTVILEATFQNSNLKADLPYTAVGFFAKRGDDAEKLIAVGVATEGAYLAATSPDGVATDALDIKVAIAIGDSANVTAMIDPAGSVTPAALHNAITDVKSEMKTGLDTKADKSTVDSDVKSINDTLATKADKQTVTDDLVKKADKTDVDAQIGTVNKSVSDLSDTVKANKDDTDKVLATKADKDTVESELSTKANQSDLDKTNAEVAKKASTTDVNSQLATKADAKDVTDALALKDDTVDVDKKISNVTNSVNSLSSTVTSNKSATDTALGTKANANDVANSFEEVRNRVKKLEGQQELTAPDFNTLTSTGIYMIENPTNGKNSPSNVNWGTLVVSRGTTGSDSRILQEYYPDSGDLPYFRMSGPGGVWRDWKQLSDQSEINSLRDAVNTKADKTALDAYAKSADVANDVKTLQDNINAKADAQTVSDAISKIDLTPFAKTADVNSALSGKADKVTIDAINKALASKRDITDSYSRDELDKKFLQLSADTGGKVSADQVSKLIAGKADQDDVDKKIKAVTDAVNTKANSSDVTSLINSNTDKLTQAINAITYSTKERPLPSNDANEITEDGIYRVGGDPLKNGAGQQWDFLLVKKWDENTIYQMMYGGGKGIFIRNISKTGNSYPEWTRIDIDVNGLQNTLNAKANTADVNTALSKKDDITDVDAKIKTVTDLANTKADASDTYNKKAVDDAFSSRDATIGTKADKTYVDNQIASIDFSKIKFRKQYVNSDGQTADKTWSATKNQDGTYTIDLWQDDWTASKLSGVLVQLPNKADTSTVNEQIADAKNTAQSNLDKVKSDLNGAINTKANSSDLTALDKKAVKSVGIYPNNLHFDSGSFNYWSGEVKASPDANGYALIDLTDDTSVRAAANQLNAMLTGLNHLQGKQTKDSADANALSETGVYYCSSPAKNFPVGQWGTLVTSNGDGARASQLYFPDDNSAVWFRTLDGDWRGWVRLANIDDVNNAESSLTSSINAVSNKVNVTVPLFRRITAANTWNDILGASNGDTPVLVSIRDEGGANTLGNYSAAVAFGGRDTKGVLNVAYSDHTARIIGGNGNAPVWHEDIAWKSDISNLQNIINQQNQTIQSLTTRLTNVENEIRYIKANYVEGRTFPASQEAQANSWENENPQRIAFITK